MTELTYPGREGVNMVRLSMAVWLVSVLAYGLGKFGFIPSYQSETFWKLFYFPDQ